jgi:hypothetical protein
MKYGIIISLMESRSYRPGVRSTEYTEGLFSCANGALCIHAQAVTSLQFWRGVYRPKPWM